MGGIFIGGGDLLGISANPWWSALIIKHLNQLETGGIDGDDWIQWEAFL